MSKHYLPYLIEMGLDEHKAHEVAKTLNSWEDLICWIDQNQKTNVYDQKPLDSSISIKTPKYALGWKAAIGRIFKTTTQREKPQERGWVKVVAKRKKTARILGLLTTILLTALTYETTIISANDSENWKIARTVLYAAMTYFMCIQFFNLILGTIKAQQGSKGNPWHPKHTERPLKEETRIAILFPVYHEDPSRVMAGIASLWESLRTYCPKDSHRYDIFLISDSREIAYWITEQAAIEEIKEHYPDGRFYYRNRPSNHNSKMGNITDWCRRWGDQYQYMLVMDADSLMSGKAIHTLARMMEGNDKIGILQTNPTPILRQSLFGRMQQFAGRLYGTVFSYSMQAVYMGHAIYIGHNAMIRTKPFIEHCILPELDGADHWNGKPMSHDIIEAAMMARSGYEVWFLPEIEGSYEEIPANVLGFMIRERRWMQGNIQHIRLLFLDGLKGIHRENFINGIMGYSSAPLWVIFIAISLHTMSSVMKSRTLDITSIGQFKAMSFYMLAAAMIFLLIPRALAVGFNLKKEKRKGYGGAIPMITSLVIETLSSFFFSPMIMAFITKFMIQWLKKKSVKWGTQQRDDTPLTWRQCRTHFGWMTAIGFMGWAYLYYQETQTAASNTRAMSQMSHGLLSLQSIFLWTLPIFGSYAFSIIIARVTSRTFPIVNHMKLFSIPEEIHQPKEITDLIKWQKIFEEKIPNPEDYSAYKTYLYDKPKFFLLKRSHAKSKKDIAQRLVPKIQKAKTLTQAELYHAIKEKDCLDALYLQYMKNKESQEKNDPS